MADPQLIYKTGIIWLVSLFFGELARRLKLPVVIGYLAGGALLGPFGLNILDLSFLKGMTPVKEFLLAYILYLVGKHVRLEAFRGEATRYTVIALFQAFLTFLFVTILMYLLTHQIAPAIVTGLIAAPTAAISVTVIEEYNAEGSLSQLIFLMIAIDNLLALLAFRLVIPFLSGAEIHWVASVGLLVLSGMWGVLLGLALAYLETVIQDITLLSIVSWGLFFLGLGIAARFQEPYVFALMFGITASNASVLQKRALEPLNLLSEFVYALFFFIAGASINFPRLVHLRFAVWFYILGRTAGKLLGAWLPTKRWRLEVDGRLLGLGILAQGGMSTGLALYVGTLSPEYAGVMNIALAATVIFEIAGLILLRQSLVWAGEVTTLSLIQRGVEPLLDQDFHRLVQTFLGRLGIEWGTPTPLTLETLVRRRCVILSPNDSLETVAQAFRKLNHDALPVLDERGFFAGVVFFRDFEKAYLQAQEKGLNITVRNILKQEMLHPSMSLLEAMEHMREVDADALPLVQDHRLMGIVLRKDLLSAIF